MSDAEGQGSSQSSAPPSRGDAGDPAYDSSGGWNRLIAVGGPAGGDLGMAPGTRLWRSALLLWVAADHRSERERRDHRPDRERWAAAERLVDDVFRRRLHRARVREARRHGISEGDLRKWAVHFLVEGVWRRERGSARYEDLVRRLADYLNDRVAAEALGSDWGKIVGKRDGEPPEFLDAPVPGADEDDGTVRVLLNEVGVHDPRFGKLEARLALRTLIRRAELTDGERSCLLLRKLRGCNVEETAERTGCTEGSVRALTSRAVAKLKEAAAAA